MILKDRRTIHKIAHWEMIFPFLSIMNLTKAEIWILLDLSQIESLTSCDCHDAKGLNYALRELISVQNSLGVLEVMKWYKFWFLQRWTCYGRRIWKLYQEKYWADVSLKCGINKPCDNLEFYFSILVCFMMFSDWAFTVVSLCAAACFERSLQLRLSELFVSSGILPSVYSN